MGLAVAHEGDLRSIGGPDGTRLTSLLTDVRLEAEVHGVACGGRRARTIDLAVLHVEDRAAIGRKLRRGSFYDAPRRASARAHRPDATLGATRIVRRIRDPADAI